MPITSSRSRSGREWATANPAALAISQNLGQQQSRRVDVQELNSPGCEVEQKIGDIKIGDQGVCQLHKHTAQLFLICHGINLSEAASMLPSNHELREEPRSTIGIVNHSL